MKTISEICSIITKAGLTSRQAVTLTSAFTESELAHMIEAGDTAALQQCHGIGPKSAEKLLALKGVFSCEEEVKPVEIDYNMYSIRRLSLNPNYCAIDTEGKEDRRVFVIDEVTQRLGPLQQKILEMSGGNTDVLFKTVSTINEKDPEEIKSAKMTAWHRTVINGLKSKSGLHYIPYGHGTNAAKENCLLWADDKLVSQALEWANCDASPAWKVTPAKKVAYQVGLLSVFTKELPFDLQPKQCMFFESLVREHSDLIVRASADGSVTPPAMGTVSQNEFDGLAVFHVSEKLKAKLVKSMNQQQREAFEKAMAQLKDFTFRAPYQKGLAVTFFDIHKYLHDHNIHVLNGKDIDDIVLFADETVFKASIGGEGAAYSSYSEYCEAFHKYNHRFGKLIEEHADTPHNLPYQQIQTACRAEDGTVIEGAMLEAQYLNSFKDPKKAASLLGGELAQLARLHPEIVSERWFAGRIQASYSKLRKEALGATAHEITHYAFICPDLIAFAQHIAGMKVTGCLGDHEAYLKNSVSGEAVITRSPCLDPGSLCIMNIVDNVGCYETYFSESTTLMQSCSSTEVTRYKGDFDGDHALYSRTQWYVDAVKQTHEAYGDFLVDFEAPKTQKSAVSQKDLEQYYMSLVNTNRLGQYCDCLTKLYGKSEQPDRDTVSWLTFAANVLVDSSKHGGTQIKVPEAVKELTKEKLPKFSVAAKENKHGDKEYKGEEEYGNGRGDLFARTVAEHTEETLAIEGLERMPTFDVGSLMYDPTPGYRGLSGLTRYGRYDPNLGYAPDMGLFQSLCFRSAAEWNEIKKSEEGRKSAAEYDAWKRSQALSEIRAFAEERGRTIEDAYDVIVSWCFSYAYSKPALAELMFEGLRRFFGGMMLTAAKGRR